MRSYKVARRRKLLNGHRPTAGYGLCNCPKLDKLP
jgi:hypothetical protein